MGYSVDARHPDDGVGGEAVGVRKDAHAVCRNKCVDAAVEDVCRQAGFGVQTCAADCVCGELGEQRADDDRD